MEFGKSCWYSYQQGCEREWIITNGIGGYASLSLICSNNRRYHGLLVSALKPPTGRQLFLSNILEELVFPDGSHVSLSSFKTGDGYINDGFSHLQRVNYGYLPEFVYSYRDIIIKKKVAMKYGQNTTVLQYEIRNGSSEAVFKLSPLINNRDHHHSSKSRDLKFKVELKAHGVSIFHQDSETGLGMFSRECEIHSFDNCFFYNMFYGAEQERGLEDTEDHFMPGCFNIELKPLETKIVSFSATTEKYTSKESDSLGQWEIPEGVDAGEVIVQEENRLRLIQKRSGFSNEFCRRLVLAADSFIVYRRSTDSKTIIAGYPWFTDWGRDTMIALSGLTLVTGRYEDARDILLTFSKYTYNGLIPNMFPDNGEKPAYNSVDAALWYFDAVNSYLEYTGDYRFVRKHIYSCLKQICSSFTQGTVYDIGMTEDGLITAGNECTQLTWMDAKVGDWVVTPRQGKAVEINALWYNALMVMSKLASKFDDEDIYTRMAENTKLSFERVFWNNKSQCLYDVVNSSGKDESIRPNQILAVGLAYPVIDGEKAVRIIQKVWSELYTPYGLRTIAVNDPAYRGLYHGGPFERDGAYHQGTVWAWLLGRFIKAYVRFEAGGEQTGHNALDFISPFVDHIKDGGLGSISEIFDGDNPHYPRGCFAQAWSVSEILRAAVEDVRIEQLSRDLSENSKIIL